MFQVITMQRDSTTIELPEDGSPYVVRQNWRPLIEPVSNYQDALDLFTRRANERGIEAPYNDARQHPDFVRFMRYGCNALGTSRDPDKPQSDSAKTSLVYLERISQ